MEIPIIKTQDNSIDPNLVLLLARFVTMVERSHYCEYAIITTIHHVQRTIKVKILRIKTDINVFIYRNITRGGNTHIY